VGQTRGPVTNDVLNTGTYINDVSLSDPGGIDVLSIVGNSVSGQSNLIDSFYGAGRTDTTTRGGDDGGAGNTGSAGPAGGLGDVGGFNTLVGNSVLNNIGALGGLGQSFGFGDDNGGGLFGEGQGPDQNGQNGQGEQGVPGPGAALRPTGRAGFSDQLAQAAGGVTAEMSRLAKAVEQAQESSAA